MDHDAENRQLVEQSCVEFERDLRAFLNGMLRDVHLVDDAFQKTVIQAIQASSKVKPATVRGWLFRVALNVVREQRRGQKRQGQLHRAVWESKSPEDSVETTSGFSEAATEEDRASVRRALARLSSEYREVVTRRIHQDQTFAVIANEMNKPLGTILTWMRRALAELKEMDELKHLAND